MCSVYINKSTHVDTLSTRTNYRRVQIIDVYRLSTRTNYRRLPIIDAYKLSTVTNNFADKLPIQTCNLYMENRTLRM